MPAAATAEVTEAVAAETFAEAMAECLAAEAPWPGAVAVSGGGDSLALMLLLRDWAKASSRPPPAVLAVDHGLSEPGSRAAAGAVGLARRFELEAHLLSWRGPKPTADLEAAAREARYRLMGDWCAARGVSGLYLAHTLEDQAETFLLRLGRGSGLDGLAAMRAVSPYPLPGHPDQKLVRPVLDITRGALRAFLMRRGVEWAEDPMNGDPRFARVRIRQAWPQLEEIGLSPARVAAASGHLARARRALEEATREFLNRACRFEADRIVLDGASFAAAPEEIGLRALAQVLSQLSHAVYRPRFERLEALYRAIKAEDFGAARTLHGCRVAPAGKSEARFGPRTLLVTREKREQKTRKPAVAAVRQIS